MHNIKNVVFFISELGGGVPRYSLNHAKELFQSGYNVFFFNNGVKSMLSDKEIEGISLYNIELTTASFESKIKELGINQFDTSVICTESFELDFFYNNRLNYHIVFVAHGEYSYYFNSAIKYIGIIDSVACVSKSIHRKLKGHKLLYNKSKVFYVPHRLEKNESQNTQKIEHSIAFIGRPTEAKGFHVLIKLINELEEENIFYNWQCFGFNKPIDFESKCDTRRIEFYGQLEHSDLLNKLSKCEYLILPSSHEGLPLSVLEALNCGLIPICNLFNKEITQIVYNNKNGYIVKENNIIEYKKILKTLYNTGIDFPEKFNNEILKHFYSTSFNQLFTKKYKPKYYKGLQNRLLQLTN